MTSSPRVITQPNRYNQTASKMQGIPMIAQHDQWRKHKFRIFRTKKIIQPFLELKLYTHLLASTWIYCLSPEENLKEICF